jgi:hypothetical protein
VFILHGIYIAIMAQFQPLKRFLEEMAAEQGIENEKEEEKEEPNEVSLCGE